MLGVNKVVILDKKDYFDKVNHLIHNIIKTSFPIHTFRNVPISCTLLYLTDLHLKITLDHSIVEEEVPLDRKCMNQNYFQFDGFCYRQSEVKLMGNFLSPFIAYLFMNRCDTRLCGEIGYFLRVWLRYM